ncbi:MULTISPECIES: hypothetical protein [unclassified Exiguobacterium]|uniref:hypothetical protein n=1 Tax=unclassified Exiguobacterium TaxID=2644629 RepID=UPI001039466A|nr:MULTISPECIES: hypothetical protein [unclassified Exiguobacterium]TCI39261.1 hypothetical protein EVJ29_01060 [Exiguobacterium sp. SH4S7]TCI62950.1 hypothetical protein EVJ21_05405 [Exiguobacterium sp. SH0S2]
MFKRPIHNVLTGLGMIAVFCLGWWIWYVLNGSDAAEQRAVRAAETYVDMTYPELELNVIGVTYLSLYDAKYYVLYASPSHVDTELWVRVTRAGEVVDDNFGDAASVSSDVSLSLDRRDALPCNQKNSPDEFVWRVFLITLYALRL